MKNQKQTRYAHLCVRAEVCPVPITSPEVARWLWPRLRAAFPVALSAILMPDHLHVVAPTTDPSRARITLGATVSGLRRSNNPGAANRFGPAYAEAVFDDARKLHRQTRYVVLNPCREGLVDDPLAWCWSTHRDVMGATANPWVPERRIVNVLATTTDEHHRYVSGDWSTRVEGTPPPPTITRRVFSLEEAWAGATAAFRAGPDAVRRKGPVRRAFIALASRSGITSSSVLAEICGVQYRSIQRWRARGESPPPAAIACAADPRLRAYLGTTIRLRLENLLSARARSAGRAQAQQRENRRLEDGAQAWPMERIDMTFVGVRPSNA